MPQHTQRFRKPALLLLLLLLLARRLPNALAFDLLERRLLLVVAGAALGLLPALNRQERAVGVQVVARVGGPVMCGTREGMKRDESSEEEEGERIARWREC